jgi:hypothetical protein
MYYLHYFSFTINDLANEGFYMVKFSIHLCLEISNPDNCVIDLPIMDNVKLPKQTCNWNKGFNIDSKYKFLNVFTIFEFYGYYKQSF